MIFRMTFLMPAGSRPAFVEIAAPHIGAAVYVFRREFARCELLRVDSVSVSVS
tara:strand:+ start:331 stop:489 length:159 start_codon:yes stop_codon:yes gene_type:complete